MKNCLVTLANNRRHHEVINLINNVNSNLLCGTNDFDFIIFHEKGFDKKNLPVFNGRGNFFSYEINLDINQFAEKIRYETPALHYGFSIGYRMMCRFFAGEIFKILKNLNYEYMMRLDTDSSFYEKVNYNLFDKLKNKNAFYGFVSVHNDAIEFSNDLLIYVNQYAQNKQTNLNFYKVINNQSNLVYYNNFEILKLSEFTCENYLFFYDFLDSKNGFLKYRWGDHAVRFLYTNLFMAQDKILYYENLPYFHQIDLKNKPFLLKNYWD